MLKAIKIRWSHFQSAIYKPLKLSLICRCGLSLLVVISQASPVLTKWELTLATNFGNHAQIGTKVGGQILATICGFVPDSLGRHNVPMSSCYYHVQQYCHHYDSDSSLLRPLVPAWNNTKRYIIQAWHWIMNISLYYCHSDTIELGLACFTTQIGSLLNTATPVDITQLDCETVSMGFDWLPFISGKRHGNQSKMPKM